MIIGHRGAAEEAPENTMISVEKAIGSGCTWIEVDTQLSADGVPVIIHDNSVDRCTNGTGYVSSLSCAELQSLDAGSWFSDEFRGAKIPSLEELLRFCKARDVGINLELKVYDKSTIGRLVTKVCEIILKVDFKLSSLLISSFSIQAIKAIKREISEMRIGLIVDDASQIDLDEIKTVDIFSIHADYKSLTVDIARDLQKKGYEIYIWTVNDPVQKEIFKRMNVINIITDRPSNFLGNK
ncbi:Glycerophosphoryl diester phosphodiesterase [Vibrio thalassae]|uniref:Glycerophosphoryl diester phosphodiesterase n=1 Tax=Vibrio thalassae TaxID=1243014 RepID=A0A240ENP5_9VIBR|nr:glycerophosphodiester phosphodiesterase family protein [Vibrio thalassae]SNX50268.1 Glycerophosphoryl diester phosphodiesterase [Vibrio thalassae]